MISFLSRTVVLFPVQAALFIVYQELQDLNYLNINRFSLCVKRIPLNMPLVPLTKPSWNHALLSV